MDFTALVGPPLSTATLTVGVSAAKFPCFFCAKKDDMPATSLAPELFAKARAPKIWGQMPSRIKVLFITTLHRTGGWLAEAFRSDCAADVTLVETIGVTAGLSHLRDEVFDAVLLSHEPNALDAL